MPNSDDYMRTFLEVVASQGWRRAFSPGEVIEMWDSFVSSCEEGYGWSIYEYYNEISVRDLIEVLLDQPTLREAPQQTWFREGVEEIDRRFNSLIKNGPKASGSTGRSWWRAQFPRYGGQEFAADVQARTGVSIEVRK